MGCAAPTASSSAATLLKFPELGHGRHFFNPVDFMIYGFSPVLPAYGVPGATWHSGNAYDFHEFGVTGATPRRRAAAGQGPGGHVQQALEVRSTLTQKGFRLRQRRAHDVVRARSRPGEADVRAW